MNVYGTRDYRELINNRCEELGLTYRDLSTRARIHASYFSRVMLGKAEFSQDQLFLIGKHLSLREKEHEYLMLLGDHSRSSHTEHKIYIGEKIRIMRDTHSRVGDRLQNTKQFDELDMSTYYQEAITARIHMWLTIEKYRKQPQLIARRINISENKLRLEVLKLKQLKLLEENSDGSLSLTTKRVHLPAESHLSPQNHINWRLEAIRNISLRTSESGDYHMSATFTATSEGKQKIRELFKEFIGRAQREAGECGAGTDVFALTFDLFDS